MIIVFDIEDINRSLEIFVRCLINHIYIDQKMLMCNR